MLRISLHCLAGPLRGQIFHLDDGPVFIFGRYAKADFVLASDAAASHLHFLIDTSDDRIRIIDLGSTNGLVINEKHMGGKQGPRLDRFVTLKSGDTILAGACLFRLSVVDEDTESQPSVVGTGKRRGLQLQPDAAPDPAGRRTTVLAKGLVEERLDSAVDEDDEPPTLPQFTEDSLPNIDGYTLLQKIGGGGKGVVYKAVKDDSGATAAIKMLVGQKNKAKSQRAMEMFRREIQITKQLRHPNIVRYIGDGLASGSPYLAIEYVDGGNLDELIRSSPDARLDLPRAVPLFIQLLEAVAHMHNRSLVHRDIKPKNILLDVRRGGSLAVKLSDMGLSCRFSNVEDREFQPIVAEGGTPAYMPPEQLTDVTRAIPQSDVFSSGATLYHMLTGSLLYDFSEKEQTEAILDSNIKPILEIRPDLPARLADVVDRSLAYAPEERYANAQEMLTALKSALGTI